MCDYSLAQVATRKAAVGDTLKVRDFGTGTRGFGPADGEDVAVCVLPGTEIAFDAPIRTYRLYDQNDGALSSAVGIFRQVDKDTPHTHHDALGLPDGTVVKLHNLLLNQTATILQLPAAPKTAKEAEDQTRLVTVG